MEDAVLMRFLAFWLVGMGAMNGCLKPHPLSTPELCDQEIRVLIYENLQASLKSSGEDEGVSYKDVRDIFDRKNCSVCHWDEKGLDLRRYPFRLASASLTAQHTMFDKIWMQITKVHEPDVGVSPVTTVDLERLEQWRRQGVREDSPSPLLRLKQPFKGDIVLIYQVSGEEERSGAVPLKARTGERSFGAVLSRLPKGAQLSGRIQVYGERGVLLRETKLSEIRLGKGKVETMIINL